MSTMPRFDFRVGMDVHNNSITIAVFRDQQPESHRVDPLPYDDRKLRRYSARPVVEGEFPAYDEASGACHAIQRALVDWGIRCEVAAPSPIPRRLGNRTPAITALTAFLTTAQRPIRSMTRGKRVVLLPQIQRAQGMCPNAAPISKGCPSGAASVRS